MTCRLGKEGECLFAAALFFESALFLANLLILVVVWVSTLQWALCSSTMELYVPNRKVF